MGILLGIYIGIAIAVFFVIFIAECTDGDKSIWMILLESILIGALWPLLFLTFL